MVAGIVKLKVPEVPNTPCTGPVKDGGLKLEIAKGVESSALKFWFPAKVPIFLTGIVTIIRLPLQPLGTIGPILMLCACTTPVNKTSPARRSQVVRSQFFKFGRNLDG